MTIPKSWKILTVPVAKLQATLIELEQSHRSECPPILVYIDIERVLVAWRY